MQNSFSVEASSGAYGIEIGVHLPWMASIDRNRDIVICDAFFEPVCRANGLKVVGIVALETSKDIGQMSDVISQLAALGANRKTTLVAVGGGNG